MSYNDFSVFALFTAGLAAFAPVVNAYTQPKGDEPKGNPIASPGLHEVVPACKQYTVSWQPTTQGTIDLVLLKGPSTNAVPQYALAQGIPNTGSYLWTPSADLVPTGNQGYGLEIIDTATGQYQYSTQFGISTSDCPKSYSSSSSSSSSSSASAPGSYHSSSSSSSTTSTCTTHSYGSGPSSYASANGTAAPTGHIPHNSTIIHPTGSMTVPSSLRTYTTGGPSATYGNPAAPTYGGNSSSATPSAPAATGAAAANVVGNILGLALAGAVAVFAL